MILSYFFLFEKGSVDPLCALSLPPKNRKYYPKQISLNLDPSILRWNFIIRLFPLLELLNNEYNKDRNACIFYI